MAMPTLATVWRMWRPSQTTCHVQTDQDKNRLRLGGDTATVAPAPTLHSLPDEILPLVFSHLPLSGMAATSLTCRRFRLVTRPKSSLTMYLCKINSVLKVTRVRFPDPKLPVNLWSIGDVAKERRMQIFKKKIKDRILNDVIKLIIELPAWHSELPAALFFDMADRLTLAVISTLKFVLPFEQDTLIRVILKLLKSTYRFHPSQFTAVIAELAQIPLGDAAQRFVDRQFRYSLSAERCAILAALPFSRIDWKINYHPNHQELARTWLANSGIGDGKKLRLARALCAARRYTPVESDGVNPVMLSEFMQHKCHLFLEAFFQLTSALPDRISLDIEMLLHAVPEILTSLGKKQKDPGRPIPSETASETASLIALILQRVKYLPAQPRSEILYLAQLCCVIHQVRERYSENMLSALAKASRKRIPDPEGRVEVLSRLLQQRPLSETKLWRLQKMVLDLPPEQQRALGPMFDRNRNARERVKRH